MKKIITILFICAMHFSFAQSSTKTADRLFDKMWYKEAAALYESEVKALENRSKPFDNDQKADYVRVLERAGDSYFFNTDMENAYRFYDKLVSKFYSSVHSEYLFRYAHSLQGMGRHLQAKRWMKEFAKRTENKDDRSQKLNQKEHSIEDVLDGDSNFMLKNVSVNTKYSDFGPMYYKDKLVYSSAIDSSNYHTRIYHWNEQPFLDMYIGELDEIESDFKFVSEFSEALNTNYHEATLAFSPDERTVYFTRNNFNGDLHRDDNGTNHLKLYRAELGRDEDDLPIWVNEKELPFNSDSYSVGHPTISKDGKLLYFVSDMPGSIGATDVFVVDVIDGSTIENDSLNGEIRYSKPRNLGEKVNTAGREMFPFITNKKLYFASDGHLGVGGLDVYESKIVEANFTTPVNMGMPLNSELDDFGFIIKEEKSIGFVCSNRSGGKGDDDIYSFVRSIKPEREQGVKSKEEIKESVVACKQLIKGSVVNRLTGGVISKARLVLYDKKGVEIERTLTSSNGEYQFQNELNCNASVSIVLSKMGHDHKKVGVLTLDKTGETIVPFQVNALNPLIVEENGVLKIKVGMIHFDLNKAKIRKLDAVLKLNKIVQLMAEYPNMVIKIESHTDSRASDAYNLTLSDKRAKVTRDYIVSQGISASRVESAIGYGETQLVNRCANGVSCIELQHELNRRSEFIILRM